MIVASGHLAAPEDLCRSWRAEETGSNMHDGAKNENDSISQALVSDVELRLLSVNKKEEIR